MEEPHFLLVLWPSVSATLDVIFPPSFSSLFPAGCWGGDDLGTGKALLPLNFGPSVGSDLFR